MGLLQVGRRGGGAFRHSRGAGGAGGGAAEGAGGGRADGVHHPLDGERMTSWKQAEGRGEQRRGKGGDGGDRRCLLFIDSCTFFFFFFLYNLHILSSSEISHLLHV